MPAQCRVEVYRGPCADTSVDLSCSRVESEIMLAVRLVAVARVLRESRRCLATHLCDKCCSYASRVKLVDVDLELDFVVNSISNLPNQFQFQFQRVSRAGLARLEVAVADDRDLALAARTAAALAATVTVAAVKFALLLRLRCSECLA